MDLGIFSDATIDENDAEEVFRAFLSIEKLGFGCTEKHEVRSVYETGEEQVDEFVVVPGRPNGVGAFAYNPLGRAGTTSLPSRGRAR